jgi:ribosomal protein S27AE
MSATGQLQVAPVPATIDNAADWQTLADQITVGTGMPTVVTPEMILGMLGSAVPLLFAADTALNLNLLRGTFSDPVVAQCTRNAGTLAGALPTAVAVHLAGSRVVDGHPVVRAHLSIQANDPHGNPTTCRQFWDLQFGGQVTVSQPSCPNCGAPVGEGELICGHCHADVRSVVDVPIVVSRLDLY